MDFRSSLSDPKGFLKNWTSLYQCNSVNGWRGITCDQNGRVTVMYDSQLVQTFFFGPKQFYVVSEI